MAGSGVIAVSMGVMNIGTYGFTLLTARVLGPREYGALAALMGVMIVLNVLSLGLMATAARRVSTADGDTSSIEAEVARTSYRAAFGLGALTLASTPVLTPALHLDSWLDVPLMAVAMVPLTLMGAQSGILQGERRWLPLAGIFLGMGLGRLLFGLATVAWRPDSTGAMLGVALGGVVPAVIGWAALRTTPAAPTSPEEPPAPVAVAADPGVGAGQSFLGEVMHNSHALLAFFALSNTDVIVARTILGGHQSGLYAGGLILAKAVLFLPQFVVVLVFPAMAASKERRRVQNLALALVAAIGAVATAGAWALSGLAVLFVGGAEYAELDSRIWAFASIGTLLAMLQMVVYGTVARQHHGAVYVIWAGVALLVALTLGLVDTLDGLLVAVVTVQAGVLATLVLLGLRQDPAALPTDPEPSVVGETA